MIIYSITFAIEDSIEKEWLEYMKEQYIQEVMEIGLFNDYRFSKTHPVSDVDTAFNIQFRCESLTHLELFEKQHAPSIDEKLVEKYKGKFGTFRMVMEEIIS